MSSFVLRLCLLVCIVSTATAQDDEFRIGFGAAINPITLLTESDGSNGNLTVPIQTAAVFLPMLFGENLRVEPQFSLIRLAEDKITKDDAGKTRGTYEGTTSGLMLGTGVFYGFDLDAATKGYLGARFGIISSSSSAVFTPVNGDDSEVSYSQINLFYGPALGGEYYLSRHMSLGVELGLNVLSYGNVDYEAEPSIPDPSRSEVDQTLISTSALVFARLYLN